MPYEKTIPVWLEAALAELGVHETPGFNCTARIAEYFKSCNAPPNDEIPWCSCSLNWVFESVYIKGTGSLVGRSWLMWGEICDPRLGAVVIFDRPEAPHTKDFMPAHVGLQLDEYGGWTTIIGGNQSNRFGVGRYPTKNILGRRWPKTLFNNGS